MTNTPLPPSVEDGIPARVMLRPLGNPLPLVLLAQAVASFCVASVELGWIGVSQIHHVAWAVLVLTVPLQIVAAVLGFLSRDPVAGTGPALFAGTWAAIAVNLLVSSPGSTSGGLGIVLVAVSAVLLVPAVAGITKVAVAAVLLVASARFGVTGVYELTADAGWQTAAGVVGLVLAAVSTYAALALELEAGWGRTVLPVGRYGPAREPGEPGVREVL